MKNSVCFRFALMLLTSLTLFGGEFNVEQLKHRYSVGSPDSAHVFSKLDKNFFVTKGNHVFVCDMSGGKVFHFGPDGKLVGVVGKPGSGPGEYRLPFTVISNEKTIMVSDMMRRRVLTFKMSGEYISTIEGYMVERFISMYEDGTYIAVVMGGRKGRQVLRFAADGKEVGSLLSLTEKKSKRSDFVAAPKFTLTAFEDGYVYVPSELFSFRVYNEVGKPINKIEKEFERVAYIPEEHAKGGIVTFGGGSGEMPLARKQKFERDIQRVASSEDGFWVTTALKNDKGNRLVFTYDKKGTPTGKLSMPGKYGMPYRVEAKIVWTLNFSEEHGVNYLMRLDR